MLTPFACALPPAATLDAGMRAAIGQPEAAMIQARGVPTRSSGTGGLRFIEDERRRFVRPSATWRAGSPFAGTFLETRDGRLTFTLRKDRVQRIDRRGKDRLALPEACAS
jgi:hypothetical protein